MQCPGCGSEKTSVLDSRYKKQIQQKRRKRKCRKCGEIFITLEEVASSSMRPPRMIKRDGRREAFDHEKLRKGLLLAVAKRPVSTESVDKLIDRIVERLAKGGKREVAAAQVGEAVMRELARLDRVAYIRFASVYRNFRDTGAFKKEAENVEKAARQGILDTQGNFDFYEDGRSDDPGDDSGDDPGNDSGDDPADDRGDAGQDNGA